MKGCTIFAIEGYLFNGVQIFIGYKLAIFYQEYCIFNKNILKIVFFCIIGGFLAGFETEFQRFSKS